MPLILNHAVRAVLRFINKDEPRTVLQYVLAEPGKFVGTDGHRLVILTQKAPGDAPPWVPDLIGDEPTWPVMLDSNDVATSLSSLPKAKKLSESSRQAYMSAIDEKEACFVTWTPEANSLRRIKRYTEGTYPFYKRVIPAGMPLASICVDPSYLKDICQAAMDIGAESLEIHIFPNIAGEFPRQIMATAQTPTHELVMVLAQRRGEAHYAFAHEVDEDTASMMLATCGG